MNGLNIKSTYFCLTLNKYGIGHCGLKHISMVCKNRITIWLIYGDKL